MNGVVALLVVISGAGISAAPNLTGTSRMTMDPDFRGNPAVIECTVRQQRAALTVLHPEPERSFDDRQFAVNLRVPPRRTEPRDILPRTTALPRDSNRCSWDSNALQIDDTSKTATRNGTFSPHPYSSEPAEILENVAAAVRQGRLDEAWRRPDLGMRKGELRARRILDVTSLDRRRRDFYVVEFIDGSARLVANVAVYKSGIVIGAQRIDRPELQYPLDLADASTRAKRFGTPRSAKYVHLLGPPEVGSSVFIPLPAVDLQDGTVYFNLHGEAFADENSGLAKRVGVQDDKPLPAGMVKLRKLKAR